MFEKDVTRKEQPPQQTSSAIRSYRWMDDQGGDERIREPQRQLTAQSRVKLMNCNISVEKKSAFWRGADIIHNVADVTHIERDVLCFALTEAVYHAVRCMIEKYK